MTPVRSQGGLIIFTTFLATLVLTVLPLPDWAQPLRPAWCTLVLIYWCLALPQRVGVIIGWLTGIAVDVVTETLLGQHALGLAIVAFITLKLHQRVRLFPLWQQALVVFLILALERLLYLLVAGATGHSIPGLDYWGPVFAGMLLWPWVYIVLRDVRRRFRVS